MLNSLSTAFIISKRFSLLTPDAYILFLLPWPSISLSVDVSPPFPHICSSLFLHPDHKFIIDGSSNCFTATHPVAKTGLCYSTKLTAFRACFCGTLISFHGLILKEIASAFHLVYYSSRIIQAPSLSLHISSRICPPPRLDKLALPCPESRN